MRQTEKNLVILYWRESFYIARYSPIDRESGIVSVKPEKISKEKFDQIKNDYPILKVSDDLIFDMGNDIEHIAKISDNELGRLTHKDIQRIYRMLGNNIIVDFIPNLTVREYSEQYNIGERA